MSAPLIQLEAGGVAPVLRYDLPEPTSYEGKNFIELDIEDDDGIFVEAASEMPTATAVLELQQLPRDVLRAELAEYVRTGVAKRPGLPRINPGALRRGGFTRSGGLGSLGVVAPVGNLGGGVLAGAGIGGGVIAGPPPGATPPVPGSSVFDDLVVDALLVDVLDGHNVVPGVGVDGEPTVETVPIPVDPDPHLYLVESLRLTSFLGDYGAGRIVKTFTLLPGEITKISIRSFKGSEVTRKSASSVLDSLTRESASDLETSVTREQSDQKSYQKTKEYYADAEASASWGWGSAKVKAGIKGSSNAAREESVKNVTNATEKHSARASAKREVEVNTSYEETVRTEEEVAIERQIENINLSRTLNFVFRQMNQQFVTLLHITDVRVGFFNGDRASRREVPLSRLDALLAEVVKPQKRAAVRAVILEQLFAVRGLDGVPVDVVRRVQIGQGDEFIQFDPTLTATHTDAHGRSHTVPGVLLEHRDLVMRTEGVVVEALLGNGDALDGYAAELQGLEVQRREAEVALAQAKALQLQLVNGAIDQGDEDRAARAERLACRCCCDGHHREDVPVPTPTPTDG
ncbi:MAG: hypothetical protein H0U28_12405 [Nocardioidaceae bacterium]|nr:hypothetical protein [Nocardioidaceae bacterium]